jgi:hypothetical protein
MPTRKITAASLAAAVSLIIVWAVGLAGADVPAEVASAITTVLTVGTGYLVPEKPGQ